MPTSENPSTGAADCFATTHWTAVMRAGRSHTTTARAALEQLCQAYWYPLYAYVRRRGHTPADAEDLTQEFFLRLLAGDWLAQADQQRGRFRSFLLASLKHFLANDWHKQQTWKRGGKLTFVSLNETTPEDRFAVEPALPCAPETLFDRGWANALLATVLRRLGEEYARAGKQDFFTALKPSLAVNRESIHYSGLARELGLQEGAVRVAVHRFRQRYRQILRAEIAQTVAGPDQVDDEMHYLFRVLAEN